MWQKRTHGEGLPPADWTATPAAASGKLDTLGTTGQVYEVEAIMAHTIISPTSPTGGYRLNATINGTQASFLVDTGATVTLLQEDVWERSNVTRKKLEHWSKSRLVGVDGTPLHAHGSAQVALNLNGDVY